MSRPSKRRTVEDVTLEWLREKPGGRYVFSFCPFAEVVEGLVASGAAEWIEPEPGIYTRRARATPQPSTLETKEIK